MMSTRTYAVALTSFEPIKDAIASQNGKLVDVVCDAYPRDDPDYRTFAESMIMIDKPPSNEPGCWNYCVEPLAKHLDLWPTRLPIEDWKHFAAWSAYCDAATPLLTHRALNLLHALRDGRPFLGSKVEKDGCLFAWLGNDEANLLYAELKTLDGEVFADVQLDELHEEFLESLDEVVTTHSVLFIGAH